MNKDNLLIELLTEELPPNSLRELSSKFGELIANELLLKNLIDSINIQIFSTPRRLGVKIMAVKEKAEDEDRLIKLMPARIGFSENNKPTQALLKKLISIDENNIELTKFKIQDEKDQKIIYLEKKFIGLSLETELSNIIATSLNQLPIKKVMAYQLKDGWTTVNFVRPAKNLLVLHGDKVLNVSALGFIANNQTMGHRFESKSSQIKFGHADEYEKILQDQGRVIVNFNDRKEKIRSEIDKAAKALNENLHVIDDESLLNEITALVEMPNILIGTFEKKYLEVPQECLILTMKSNQKYFPLFTDKNILSNKFIIVSNLTPSNSKNIIEGNEKVIRPRLADAQFFFEQDKKEGLESFSLKLNTIIYHNKLGTQEDRAKNVAKIMSYINTELQLKIKTDFERLALISKADLLSQMVGEFPELQGTMGRYYAMHIHESQSFANAIEDHYKPRFSGDSLPQDILGDIAALADKFETLIGLFSINENPTGDKDPFGLRRNVIGIIRIIIEKNISLNITALINHFMPNKNLDAKVTLQKFFYERLFNYLKEQNYSSDEVDAVISSKPTFINDLKERLIALRSFVKLNQSKELVSANKRVSNILKKYKSSHNEKVNIKLFEEQAEIQLYEKLIELEPIALKFIMNNNFVEALTILVELKDPIDNFFEKVMVNSENPIVKANRHNLLKQLHISLNSVADISKLAN